jgi:hypothetical protein
MDYENLADTTFFRLEELACQLANLATAAFAGLSESTDENQANANDPEQMGAFGRLAFENNDSIAITIHASYIHWRPSSQGQVRRSPNYTEWRSNYQRLAGLLDRARMPENPSPVRRQDQNERVSETIERLTFINQYFSVSRVVETTPPEFTDLPFAGLVTPLVIRLREGQAELSSPVIGQGQTLLTSLNSDAQYSLTPADIGIIRQLGQAQASRSALTTRQQTAAQTLLRQISADSRVRPIIAEQNFRSASQRLAQINGQTVAARDVAATRTAVQNTTSAMTRLSSEQQTRLTTQISTAREQIAALNVWLAANHNAQTGSAPSGRSSEAEIRAATTALRPLIASYNNAPVRSPARTAAREALRTRWDSYDPALQDAISSGLRGQVTSIINSSNI